jgi:hypothetical protein
LLILWIVLKAMVIVLRGRIRSQDGVPADEEVRPKPLRKRKLCYLCHASFIARMEEGLEPSYREEPS